MGDIQMCSTGCASSGAIFTESTQIQWSGQVVPQLGSDRAEQFATAVAVECKIVNSVKQMAVTGSDMW